MALEFRPRKITFWVYIRSFLQWTIGSIALLFYVALIVPLSLFVSPFEIDLIVRSLCQAIVRIACIHIRVHGLENLDTSTNYIFIFNHINMFDHFVIYSVLPHIARGVEKEEHFNWPIYGILIRRIGQIPIPPRGATNQAIHALERAKELFHKGISIAIAPEGTRSKTGELGPFKKGAFHLAVQLEASVAPIVLVGMHQFNRKGDWLLFPGTVDIYFEAPISTKGLTSKNVRNLTETVRSVVASRLNIGFSTSPQ